MSYSNAIWVWLQFQRFVYYQCNWERETTSNVGEQHIIPNLLVCWGKTSATNSWTGNRSPKTVSLTNRLMRLERGTRPRRTRKDGQATKGAGRMPWHQRPKKDAVSCEKLRGVASTHRSADVRMEQSGWFNNQSSYGKYIAVRGEPPELKHLSRARKRNQTRFRE